jgi:hypothetical protein
MRAADRMTTATGERIRRIEYFAVGRLFRRIGVVLMVRS